MLQRCWYSVRIALSPDKHTYNSVVRLSGNVQIRLGCTCICTINPNCQPENPGDYIIIIAASLCSRQHFHCNIIIVIIVFVSICITFHPSLLHAVFFIHFSLFFFFFEKKSVWIIYNESYMKSVFNSFYLELRTIYVRQLVLGVCK